MPHDFIAHNILLDDGTFTMPDQARALSQSAIVHAYLRLLALAFPAGLAGRSIIDVGCLEGGHAVEFARAGMAATGLEIRPSNFANCQHVKRHLDLPTLRFVQDDAENIAKHGPFDAVFACGLLYHLDNPRAWLTRASQVCGRIIMLHTHIAHREETPARSAFNLSELTLHEGLTGRWYEEHDGPPPDRLDAMKEASWDNRRSFWPDKASLIQVLQDQGFDSVFECFDCMESVPGEMNGGYYETMDRVFIIGIRSGGFSGVDDRLDVLRNSTSWRVTAPLRALAGKLR